MIESICNQIAGHTICFLGDSIVMPVRGFTSKFKEEFVQRITDAIEGKTTDHKSLNASFGDSH
jgi:NADH:ubiquinone oxidoreductase subunit F (NADH-binding)